MGGRGLGRGFVADLLLGTGRGFMPGESDEGW